jgi:hypothetical protein
MAVLDRLILRMAATEIDWGLGYTTRAGSAAKAEPRPGGDAGGRNDTRPPPAVVINEALEKLGHGTFSYGGVREVHQRQWLRTTIRLRKPFSEASV